MKLGIYDIEAFLSVVNKQVSENPNFDFTDRKSLLPLWHETCLGHIDGWTGEHDIQDDLTKTLHKDLLELFHDHGILENNKISESYLKRCKEDKNYFGFDIVKNGIKFY